MCHAKLLLLSFNAEENATLHCLLLNNYWTYKTRFVSPPPPLPSDTLSKGVDYHMPTRQWCVEMTSGMFSSQVHEPGWHVHISTRYNHVGRNLNIQIGHK